MMCEICNGFGCDYCKPSQEEIDIILKANENLKVLLKMCYAIKNRHVYVMENNYICEYCGCMGVEVNKIEHRHDCIVLEAREIIEVNE